MLVDEIHIVVFIDYKEENIVGTAYYNKYFATSPYVFMTNTIVTDLIEDSEHATYQSIKTYYINLITICYIHL